MLRTARKECEPLADVGVAPMRMTRPGIMNSSPVAVASLFEE